MWFIAQTLFRVAIGSIHAGRIFGIPVRLHSSLLIPGCLIVLGEYKVDGLVGAVCGVVLFCIIYSSLLLHELGHLAAARYIGIQAKGILLTWIGGVASMDGAPVRPAQEMFVIGAGPAVNLCIVAVLLPFVSLNSASLHVAAPSVLGFAGQALLVNIVMAAFNMIPVFPMDGGRLLRAALHFFLPLRMATGIALLVGIVLAILLGGFAAFAWGSVRLPVVFFIVICFGALEYLAIACGTMAAGAALPSLPPSGFAPEPSRHLLP